VKKIALSRAFMRSDADILVLDEPTAAMDAGAEAEVFEALPARSCEAASRSSSRSFDVRMADQIVVLDNGHIVGARQPRLAHEGRQYLRQTIHAGSACAAID